MTTLVELCAGTASVSLWALARAAPLVGYMGSKRRLASTLCHALDVEHHPPDRVVLVDAGPWGDVWNVLRDAKARADVVFLLRDRWNNEDPHDLWERLVRIDPYADPASRVAQYLWLQARSAGTIPIWWSADHGRWESPTGSRTENAHARGGSGAAGRGKGSRSVRDTRGGAAAQKGTNASRPDAGPPVGRRTSWSHCRACDRSLTQAEYLRNETCDGCIGSRADGPAYEAGSFARRRSEPPSQVDGSRGPIAPGHRWRAGCRGIQYPATIARRLLALERLPWDRIEVIHGDLRLVEPVPGSVTYFDPPYFGSPRYAALCSAVDVVAVAARHAAAGARVLVSEARPLDLDGWHHAQVSGGGTTSGGGGRSKPEWITGSWRFAVEEQLALFAS